MRIIPREKADRITFSRDHANQWAQHAAELGLDPQQIAELQQLAADAAQARRLARQARDAARSAFGDYNIILEKMTELTANCISQVRATAAREGEAIYALASLPLPRKRSRLGRPGTPYNFKHQLWQAGWLGLSWACAHPRGSTGTMYQVHRTIQWPDGRESAREFLGVTGKKKFLDRTLPLGCATVFYHVQAIRSTARGSEGMHLVHFSGANSAGLPPMEMAA